MSSTLHQPHDAYFRKVMSELRAAKGFFVQHLPPALQAQIDWDQLKLQNASFLDEHLKRSAADALYQVRLNGKLAYLYLLCEHTSEPDPLLAFRIIKYIVRIIQQHSEQYPDEPFPVVYPIVLYTGDKPYTQTLDWYELFGEHRNFMHQIFNSPVQLIEVCKIEDAILRQHLWAGAFEFMFKYRFKRCLNKSIAKQIGTWLEELEKLGGCEYTSVLLKYLLNFFDESQGEKFINTLRPYLTPRLEREMMTIGEQLTYKGMQLGIQQGIQQGEYTFLSALLEYKFKRIPIEYRKKMEQAEPTTLLGWAKRALEAKNLVDVFEE